MGYVLTFAVDVKRSFKGSTAKLKAAAVWPTEQQ